MFPSKHSNMRDMFISELLLSEGGSYWVKTEFTSRLTVQLEENAMGYLVRKWNDMEKNVGGYPGGHI